jgi:hypothetical protein
MGSNNNKTVSCKPLSNLKSNNMKPKSVILIIMLSAACVVGMGTISIIRQPYRFYNGEGNELPYHAVDSLVRSQFVRVSPAATDTIAKYFGDYPQVNPTNK